MELYQLDYVLHEPCEEQGRFYMAEIPVTSRVPSLGGDTQRDSG